jgi:hypothetical protein
MVSHGWYAMLAVLHAALHAGSVGLFWAATKQEIKSQGSIPWKSLF